MTSEVPEINEAEAFEFDALTDEQCKKYAQEIIGNKIFTTSHIHENQLETLVPMVFPILHFVEWDKMGLDKDNVGELWAYMNDAGPRSINGYPMFMTVGFWSKKDAVRIWEYAKKMQEALDSV